MVRKATSLLAPLIAAAAATTITWNNGQMCMDVNGFESSSGCVLPPDSHACPSKHVQLRHCSGNGNQQFSEGTGNQIVQWQGTMEGQSMCLAVEPSMSSGAKVLAVPCSWDLVPQWTIVCPSNNNCNWKLNNGDLCITTPGYQDTSVEGYAFDLTLGDCNNNGNGFGPPPNMARAMAKVNVTREAKSTALIVKTEIEGQGCMCNGRNCNFSPFKNDKRCVCGPAASDWIPYSQCGYNPNPGPSPSGKCSVSSRTDCGWIGVGESTCEAKGCCWAPGSSGEPWCFYPASDSMEAKLETKSPADCCCVHNGYCCNDSPFDKNTCVCGTKSSDWIPKSQCSNEKVEKALIVKTEIEGQGCMCNGRNCNFSPFKNDKRCVCGPAASDWIPYSQCGYNPNPGPSPSGKCSVSSRTDCGWIGVGESTCEAKGCCWAPGSSGEPWCFYPASDLAEIIV